MSEISAPVSGGTVRAERIGSIAVLTLDYPERRNALSLALRESLHDVLQNELADPEVTGIVLTGAGAHFCSGGDISSFEGITPQSSRPRMRRVHRIVRLLVQSEKPIIAAVEGVAAGAGISLSAACDVVVASRAASFVCSFNRIGLAPDLGALWTLRARMGLGRAKLLMMSARRIDAETAERQGLVDMIAEPGAALATAIDLAKDIAAGAPLSNAFVKTVMARNPATIDDVLAAEVEGQSALYGSRDFDEGRRAFLEKRSPSFRGA